MAAIPQVSDDTGRDKQQEEVDPPPFANDDEASEPEVIDDGIQFEGGHGGRGLRHRKPATQTTE